MKCRQMPPEPDAARCQLPDAPPPRPGGGLGEVSRAPVLMSLSRSRGRAAAVSSGVPLLATMSDVLPPSSLGSNSSRCLLSNGFVPRFPFTNASSRHSPSAAPRSSTWTAASTAFTACGASVTDLDGCKQTLPAMASGGGGGGGSSGGLDQLLGAINTLLPALHLLCSHRRTVRPRRADSQNSARGAAVAARSPRFEVLYISIYANSISVKKCNWLHLRPILLVASPQL